jgi:hypothetical protein
VVVLFAIAAGITLADPGDRVEREVVVDLVPPEDGAGEVEFVGCSKSCHDGVLTSEEQLVPERLIPDDRTVLTVDGTWPVTSTLSMREDLYYFALFGSETTDRNKRRFSTRQAAGAGTTVRFEIEATRLDEQAPMGPLPDSFPHLNTALAAETPAATAPQPPVELPAPTTAAPPVEKTPINVLVLGFMAALGLGGLAGRLIHRLAR